MSAPEPMRPRGMWVVVGVGVALMIGLAVWAVIDGMQPVIQW